MHFTVYMEDPAERAALFRMLEIWRDLTCSCVEFSSWDPEERPEPGGILFWDLDGRLPPASIDGGVRALSLLLQQQRGHCQLFPPPRGFFAQAHWNGEALGRSAPLYQAVVGLSGAAGDHQRPLPGPPPPLRSGLGGSTRRGSLVHSTQGPIATRETLTALEERLPKELFLRCQRGFLANLRHVRRLDSGGLHMSDGAVVPLSRSSRGETAEAYRKFCLLWDVRMRDGEKRHG